MSSLCSCFFYFTLDAVYKVKDVFYCCCFARRPRSCQFWTRDFGKIWIPQFSNGESIKYQSIIQMVINDHPKHVYIFRWILSKYFQMCVLICASMFDVICLPHLDCVLASYPLVINWLKTLSFCSNINSKSSNNTYINIIKILFLLLFF